MSVRVCFLIFGHEYPECLHQLIKKLWHKNFTFLVHIDKKSTKYVQYENALKEFNNVVFLPRMVVDWGSWSLSDCILYGMSYFTRNLRRHTHLSFLTETDIFLKKPNELIKFIETNKDKNFWQIFGPTPVNNWHNNYIQIEYVDNLKLHGGSTFWTLKRECIEYLLNYCNCNTKIIEKFRATISYIPDETFLATIFAASPFYETRTDTLMLSANGSNGVINKTGFVPIFGDENPGFIYNYPYKFFIRKVHKLPEKFLNTIGYEIQK